MFDDIEGGNNSKLITQEQQDGCEAVKQCTTPRVATLVCILRARSMHTLMDNVCIRSYYSSSSMHTLVVRLVCIIWILRSYYAYYSRVASTTVVDLRLSLYMYNAYA
jgi:hypothetical protein